MSEQEQTPQETLEKWLDSTAGWDILCTATPEIRRAIRAVLAENEAFMSYEPCPKCGCGVTASCYGCRLKAAEAERDALRATVRDLSIQVEESGKEERALRSEVTRLSACGEHHPELVACFCAACWQNRAAEAYARELDLEAERDALQADSLRGSPPYYRLWQEERAKREKAEAALREARASLVALYNLGGPGAQIAWEALRAGMVPPEGDTGRHWQDDAEPQPGRAQAAYQAEQAREGRTATVSEGTVDGVSTMSPWRKP